MLGAQCKMAAEATISLREHPLYLGIRPKLPRHLSQRLALHRIYTSA